MTGSADLALLASRVRTDERRIMAALERRGVNYSHVDTRTLHSCFGQRRWPVVLNREIGVVRARYAAWALEAEGSRVLNTASARHRRGRRAGVCMTRRASPGRVGAEYPHQGYKVQMAVTSPIGRL